MKRSSDKLFCCRWVRHRVPAAHREELYHILRMTGPLTINVTTAATGCGLGLACDTLVSQTFGGKNLLRVGVILQRGIIILLLFCLPCWALLINTQSILLCLGQDPDVARIAQLYITLFLPAVPAMFLHHLQVSYLQNQGIILPQMYTAAVANIANVLTNYILVHWLDLGVSGSAAANTLSQIYICIFLFAYIQWKKLHANTWGGWSAESLQEWGSYMKLAIPSALMKCFEWWVYEFGGFFAGMLSEDELAAQHAVMMVAAITYMFPFGIQAAACARVGNALGAGDSGRAILSSKVSLTLAGSIAILEGLLLASVKTVIGCIFTSDEKIISLVSHLMNAYCFLQFFDGLVSVCTGIFLGTGRQRIPAVANFIGYYCIGLSLSITLMFVAKLRVLGFWLGLLICVVLQSTFYIILIFKLDWEKMTDEAVKRARKHSEDTLLSPVTTTLGDSTTGRTPNELISAGGHQAEGTQCLTEDTEKVEVQANQGLNGNRLSNTQLIFRRGLTMFAVAALLAVGTSVHFLVPLPEIPSKNSSTTQWINTTYAPDQILTNILVGNEEPE
ncbi:multidrug and toxin extrusion protein 1-like isoform X2 [Gouania willdenowi]|uniref:multidrug and toxin extrusion protein 1-like isoform X2 n=1 Tax=Gouania willdenowi TaxID=441366 RepID=UPI001054A239|nr:multidrug and toxin extrusion protein 1-like isoform X2 [Gouania willdenowi]